jgi:hypothetical protein
MELYRDPTEYGMRVVVECLPRGINARPIAWPAMARARHRPHVMNMMNMNIQYPILLRPYSLVKRSKELNHDADHQLAAQHTNCMHATCIPVGVQFIQIRGLSYHPSHFFHLAPQGEGYLVMRPGGGLSVK